MDNPIFDEDEYRDTIRLTATEAGHAILTTLIETETGKQERVTMGVLDDATPPGTDTPGRVKEMQRAALIVERRGPDTDPYYAITGPGRTAHEHVTAGVRELKDGEPDGE